MADDLHKPHIVNHDEQIGWCCPNDTDRPPAVHRMKLHLDDVPVYRRLDLKAPPPDPRCVYTFPLPWWAGEDQMDPCRCDLLMGHDGPHACEHTRGDRG